jgi:MbtH protein
VNPFDDEAGTFLVLRNGEGQHSLWPQDVRVPAGWQVVHGPGARAECLDYVEEHWVDMRPISLARAMTETG